MWLPLSGNVRTPSKQSGAVRSGDTAVELYVVSDPLPKFWDCTRKYAVPLQLFTVKGTDKFDPVHIMNECRSSRILAPLSLCFSTLFQCQFPK